jgi:AcrR family transcriptional regulator
MAIREDFQRARTDKEKAARRTKILDAAEALLQESGNERFAISTVASQVGVSKSTVFLYFINKEDLLLSLYARSFQAILNQFAPSLKPGMTGREFCERFMECALSQPTMLVLRAQLASTLERNVPLERVVEAKQEVLNIGMPAAEKIETIFGLSQGDGLRMFMAMVNVIAGAAPADAQPYIDPDAVPEDVANLMRAASTRVAFMSAAEYVFRGATGRPFD